MRRVDIVAASSSGRVLEGSNVAELPSLTDEPPVFNLLYVSTASVSVAMALADTMQDILVASDANNRRDGITGFLLSDGYAFVQLLEGPKREVQECFSRICADGRNSSPTVRDMSRSRLSTFPQLVHVRAEPVR